MRQLLLDFACLLSSDGCLPRLSVVFDLNRPLLRIPTENPLSLFIGGVTAVVMELADPSEILDAIAVTLDTGIASENQPQYWGFDTMAEWEAAEKESEREHKKAERKFHRELLKYLRGERNYLKPGTLEMRKAEIAKKLVETDPTLLLPTRKDQLRKEINSTLRDESEL
jgi:hypothetical protein